MGWLSVIVLCYQNNPKSAVFWDLQLHFWLHAFIITGRFKSINMTIASKKGFRYDTHIWLNAFGVVYVRQLWCVCHCVFLGVLLIESTCYCYYFGWAMCYRYMLVNLSTNLLKEHQLEKNQLNMFVLSLKRSRQCDIHIHFLCIILVPSQWTTNSTNKSVPNQSIRFHSSIFTLFWVWVLH